MLERTEEGTITIFVFPHWNMKMYCLSYTFPSGINKRKSNCGGEMRLCAISDVPVTRSVYTKYDVYVTPPTHSVLLQSKADNILDFLSDNRAHEKTQTNNECVLLTSTVCVSKPDICCGFVL